MKYLGLLLRDMGTTQSQLAAMLGWHQGRISQLVHGQRRPTDNEKITLQRLTGLPGEVLFEEAEENGKEVGTTGTKTADEFSSQEQGAQSFLVLAGSR
jgi:transcriptional regulator with XRE-family HTH domain